MSEVSQGPGWWQAADLKWYPPQLHADYEPPLPHTDEQSRQPPPSEVSRGPGWWQAADLKWYPPELHADYEPPLPDTDEQRKQPADLPLSAGKQRLPGKPPFSRPRSDDRPPPQPAPKVQSRLRTPLIVGFAATLVVVAGVVVNDWFPRSHSHESQTPTAQPAPPSGPTTQPAPPPGPNPVAKSALDGLLLSPDQINTAMGGIGMTVTETATAMIDSSVDVPDNACLPMYTPIQAAAYAGSGWSALSGQALSDSVGNRTVGQDLVLFASAHDATAFFAVSAQRWPACADRQFTLTSAGSSGVYTVGPVYNTGGTLSATRSFRNDKGTYSCQRALTVANNVAIDVNACSYLSDSPSGAGVNIAGQIAAKVPT